MNIKSDKRHKISFLLRETFDFLYKERYFFREKYNLYIDRLNLRGYCGMASWYLCYLFRKYGYSAKIIHGYFSCQGFHCWVESDGIIYDITASQFGKRNVLVLDKNTKLYKKYRRYSVIKKQDYFVGWEETNIPSKRKGIIILKKFRELAKEMEFPIYNTRKETFLA